MSSSMSTKRYFQNLPRLSIYSPSQGDLGHTDLQEDLEFHSSSKPLSSLPSYSRLT